MKPPVIGACHKMPLAGFFEDIWPDEDNPNGPNLNEEALADARSVCGGCPVRTACYESVMTYERGTAAMYRMGFVADMTPLQRWSAEHRSTVYCPECGATMDPRAVREGDVACPNWCAIDRTMPPIPDSGDRWTRRHTTLARKMVRYLVENDVKEGDKLPRPRALAEQWGDRANDLCRVFEALAADGTLTLEGGTYRRGVIRGAWKEWKVIHLAMAVATDEAA